MVDSQGGCCLLFGTIHLVRNPKGMTIPVERCGGEQSLVCGCEWASFRGESLVFLGGRLSGWMNRGVCKHDGIYVLNNVSVDYCGKFPFSK